MPLYEIKKEALKQKIKNQVFRFFQDNKNQIDIYLWENEKFLQNKKSKIEKFQISHKNHIFEWIAKSRLKYAYAAQEDNILGIKRTSTMTMKNNFNQIEYNYLTNYLKEESKIIHELKFIYSIFLKNKPNFSNDI
ncbi:MAG: hypothetical protein OEZ22_07655 [Spirochaetia bacterium]|nr:hypothetical protein [Spirochaetia bacterium]